MHEAGFGVSGDANGDLRFLYPDGRALLTAPVALRPEARERPLGTEPESPDTS